MLELVLLSEKWTPVLASLVEGLSASFRCLVFCVPALFLLCVRSCTRGQIWGRGLRFFSWAFRAFFVLTLVFSSNAQGYGGVAPQGGNGGNGGFGLGGLLDIARRVPRAIEAVQPAINHVPEAIQAVPAINRVPVANPVGTRCGCCGAALLNNRFIAGTCAVPAARSVTECQQIAQDACSGGVTTTFQICRNVVSKLCRNPTGFPDGQ
jgi:hypothetical protein